MLLFRSFLSNDLLSSLSLTRMRKVNKLAKLLGVQKLVAKRGRPKVTVAAPATISHEDHVVTEVVPSGEANDEVQEVQEEAMQVSQNQLVNEEMAQENCDLDPGEGVIASDMSIESQILPENRQVGQDRVQEERRESNEIRSIKPS